MKELPKALEPLAAYDQFILWKKAPKNGKTTKIPIHYSNGQNIDSTNSTNWTSSTTALAVADTVNTSIPYTYGIGFTFTDNDPFWFLDIDNCREADGSWSPLSLDLLNRLSGAAVEVSQSGNGLHIFGTGEVPKHACKNTKLGLELYTEKRFVALTGQETTGCANYDHTDNIADIVSEYFPRNHTVNTQPTSKDWTKKPVSEWTGPQDDQELIEKMLTSKGTSSAFRNGASLRDLWEGNSDALSNAYPSDSDQPFDRSSADLALCLRLAFWTGKNCERIDRLFRLSGLNRDKWETRGDYRVRTIVKAISLCADVYSNTAVGSDDLSQCIYVRNVDRVLVPDGELIDERRFNATYGGTNHTILGDTQCRNIWKLFNIRQSASNLWVHGTCFRPSLKFLTMIYEDDKRLINVYRPLGGRQAPGSVEPFMTHVRKILPLETDQEIFLSYLAACIQNIGEKFQWCVLLQGTEGVGKTLFFNILSYAIGHRYTHLPNASDLTNCFNSWIENKLIICIEELRTSGKKDVAEALKTMITNKQVEIHSKGKDQRIGDNCANFIIFSNHKDAVLKTKDDRRYCVFFAAQQEASDLIRDDMDEQYFQRLHEWLKNDGYAYVSHYLANREININTNGRAPQTSSTLDAINSSRGLAEQLILDSIDSEEAGFKFDLVSVTNVKAMLLSNGLKVSSQAISTSLRNLGYIKHPALEKSDGKITINGDRQRIYVKRQSTAATVSNPEDIIKICEKSLAHTRSRNAFLSESHHPPDTLKYSNHRTI
ncbi:MAG: DUF5906 domain-containing protein [Agarilytica sp.]